jgi:hypothetical protein
VSSKEEDGKKLKEPDYDEDKDQLEEEQEKETGEINQRETTKQIF